MVCGLVINVNVKIIDVNGKLVYEIDVFGGQLVWDGCDYNGCRVQIGVYFVFSSMNSWEVGLVQFDVVVVKILFVN